MLASIGRVAAESAMTEAALRRLFSYLIASPFGSVIAAGEDLSNLSTMCLRVARFNTQLTDDQLTFVVESIKAVEQLRPHRNFLVHATWEKADAPGEHIGTRSSRVSTGTSRNALGTHEYLLWTPSDAEGLADAFQTLTSRIEAFIAQTWPRPLPIMYERKAFERFNNMLPASLRVTLGDPDSKGVY